MKIVVLGSPGVGKGTYIQALIKELNLVHISTGDLFRDNIKAKTELGKKAAEYISKGNLVPDEITIGMVKERLSQPDCRKGFILDGFPRTVGQAEALKDLAFLDVVLCFKADQEVILQRLGGRITCRNCGKIYHKLNLPPREEGICDACGGELYQRPDDVPEAIKNRLDVYEKQTAFLVDYYQKKKLLRELLINEDFSTHSREILERIRAALKLR